MRLPETKLLTDLDVAILGIPLDIGTSWRSGTRFGPRQIRAESNMLRPYNMWTRVNPFNNLNCADIGDIPINTFDLNDSVFRITEFYENLMKLTLIPVAMGGDHTLTLPILRALKKKYGKIGLIHVDAHADINDEMFGEKIAHGTPFRRAYEESLIDPKFVFQVGLRGTGYSEMDFEEARNWGFNIIQAEEVWHKSLTPLGKKINKTLKDIPVYLTFDIDSLDPAYAPGTGTPEIGGLTTPQAIELIRSFKGLNIIGCDLVEVSPPYDPSGNTALTAASLLYEMLCILPNPSKE
jgi:guanidinobutyrase